MRVEYPSKRSLATRRVLTIWQAFSLEAFSCSWSVQQLFTGLRMALTACFRSGCKAQEGQSRCLPLTPVILAPPSAALAIVTGSSDACPWQRMLRGGPMDLLQCMKCTSETPATPYHPPEV